MPFRKRILSTLVLLSILLGLLVSCAGENDGGDTPETKDTPDTEPVEELYLGYKRDRLSADINFNNAEISILYWKDVEQQEFEAKELTGDNVNDAIFERNAAVEERLGVTFKWHSTPGNNTNRNNFLSFVTNSVNAGERAYDIFAAYSRTTGLLMNNGFVRNLLDVDYIDLEMPWWPDSLLNRITIGDKLYFISGDISTMMLHMMYGIYFNNDMIVDYNLENPIDLVNSGKWTVDKLIEMTTGTYKDLNNDTKKDAGDFFGFATTSFHNDAFYTGAGLMLIESDPDKTLILSPDFSSEKTINLVTKLSAWIRSTDVISSGPDPVFKNGNSLFIHNRVGYAATQLRDVSFKYGLVPTPKYDESQENFVTVVGNPITMYAIAFDTDKADMAGAVIECLGSEAYRRTTPAIFEVNMKYKLSSDENVSQMFELIRDTVDFDLGRILGADLATPTDPIFNAVMNGTNWATSAATYRNQIEALLVKLVDNLQKFYG